MTPPYVCRVKTILLKHLFTLRIDTYWAVSGYVRFILYFPFRQFLFSAFSS